MRNKNGDNWLRETRFASSFVPNPLFLLPTNVSIRPYLVPKCDIVPELKKIVLLSMAKAVQKEVEITTLVAAAVAKRIGGHGVDEKGPI